LQTIVFKPALIYPQTEKNNLSNLNSENFVEIEGLIVDETRTKIGRDFYDIFYNKWTVPANAKDFTITISEKPMPRLGALVSIQINDLKVFSEFVQPRWEAIEERADVGIQRVKGYLENWEMIQNELQGEDMQGSGIF
jgi:curli production assembly/transport component CsgE